MAVTYTGNLDTALDYARWRLDDVREDSPYLEDHTYLALFARFGVQEGMAQACSTIAVMLAKKITSFGESGGIRFSKRNLDYYEALVEIIRTEPPYDSAEAVTSGVRLGRIAKGYSDIETEVLYKPFVSTHHRR